MPRFNFVRHHRIPENGMMVYSQEGVATNICGIGVRAGSFRDYVPGPLYASIYKPKERKEGIPPAPIPKYVRMQGLAHEVEHNAATGHMEWERIFRAYGCGPHGNIDIHTTNYSTFYGTDVLYRRYMAFELFDIFSQMVRYRGADNQVFLSEKSAVYNEYRLLGEDNIEDLVFRLVHETLYKKNPVRNRLDGEEEDIKRITPQMIEWFMKTYYVPNNMFAVILGPSFAEAKRIARKYFADIPSGEVPPLAYDGSDNKPELRRIESVLAEKAGISVYHVGMGFPIHPFGHKWDKEVDVLSEILEFRAHEALRHRNYALKKGTYHPRTFVSRSAIHGMIYLWFETPSESFAYEGVERIIAECEKIKQGKMSEDTLRAAVQEVREKGKPPRIMELRKKLDLERRSQDRELRMDLEMGKKAKCTEVLESFETTPGFLTSMIIEATCNGDENITSINRSDQRINKISMRSIKEAANEILTTPDRFVLAMVKPMPGTQHTPLHRDFYEDEKRQLWLPFG